MLLRALVPCTLTQMRLVAGMIVILRLIDQQASATDYSEQLTWQKIEDTRILINAPRQIDPSKPTLLIFYGLPSGNTIEQTIGCAEQPGLDWHYYIQHIGAQT